jgi:hypothetical protein
MVEEMCDIDSHGAVGNMTVVGREQDYVVMAIILYVVEG